MRDLTSLDGHDTPDPDAEAVTNRDTQGHRPGVSRGTALRRPQVRQRASFCTGHFSPAASPRLAPCLCHRPLCSVCLLSLLLALLLKVPKTPSHCHSTPDPQRQLPDHPGVSGLSREFPSDETVVGLRSKISLYQPPPASPGRHDLTAHTSVCAELRRGASETVSQD